MAEREIRTPEPREGLPVCRFSSLTTRTSTGRTRTQAPLFTAGKSNVARVMSSPHAMVTRRLSSAHMLLRKWLVPGCWLVSVRSGHLDAGDSARRCVLRLQRLQTPRIRHVHPAELAAPEVVARLREAVLAAQLLHRHALIRLPQEPDDLFL